MRLHLNRTCCSAYRAYLEGHRRYQSTVMVPLIERLYLVVLWLLPSSALRYWIHRRVHRRDELRYGPEPVTPREDKLVARSLEINNLVWTVVLASGVWTLVPPRVWHWDWRSTWAVFVCVVAFMRICEILVQSAELILRRIDVKVDHTLVTLAIYVIQAVAILTIAAELVGSQKFQSTEPTYLVGSQKLERTEHTYPRSGEDFLYMTWNNMTTVSSPYVATSNLARLVVAGSNVTAILLFTVLLGFAVGKLGENRDPATAR
jgi:hypothetical protein